MKREIDRGIYEATLVYLNDRLDLYKQFHKAAKSEKLKEVYVKRIEDCNKINDFFTDTFKPRRSRQAD